MEVDEKRPLPNPTLSFEIFWEWLVLHPNCVLRAGTPQSVLYDDEDLHWHFATEGSETLLVQIIRGKRLMGELLVQPERVAYVQAFEGEQEGEHVFELVCETEKERLAAYFFVLAHGFDEEDFPPTGRAVH